VEPFTSPLQHILAELERIDLLIRSQVWRARQIQQVDEHFQGLYIADEEVDALLAAPAGLPRWASEEGPVSQAMVRSALDRFTVQIGWRQAKAKRQGVKLPLPALKRTFGLSAREADILLIALAPEIDLRYEKLFGYLQDDITKKRPSIDLALNLLSTNLTDKLTGRRFFAPVAPLLRYHLLTVFDDPTIPHSPLLSKYLSVDSHIIDYLLGSESWTGVDTRLSSYGKLTAPRGALDELLLPIDVKQRLVRLARNHIDAHTSLVFYFQGAHGVGKKTTAAALAAELGMGLLTIDGEKLLTAEDLPFATVIRLAMREALLQGALLCWTGFDALISDERHAWRELLLQEIYAHPQPFVLTGSVIWEPVNARRDAAFVRVEFPRPTYTERLRLWSHSLNGATPTDTNIDLAGLAAKFRFTGGQIRDAAATARNLAHWRDPEHGEMSTADLHTACRLQSNRKLSELAHKITPHYVWDDIVLPADRMTQLREIVNHVRYRARVYEEWGFHHKLAMGKGLNVLFAGPSGTGKTMAADVMAGELALDLYKIDLSSVVSKYIGETEKNLARIFTEAETSNAILFFDEADALFGRRSEVRDSHDRYANIEISYLLQRMEEYDGMAILATNLHKNMDEAFVRRMHFTVDFPFPSATNRRHIWEKIWPRATPRSPALDLDFMAQRFELAGGAIRNIALAAAFLAADDGAVVEMSHLIRATQREYQKMGKVISENEFLLK